MSFISETNEEYAKREGVRASILKEILKSPAHAREMILNPKPSTPAMELGLAIHAAVLEPDVFDRYIVAPKFDRRTKEGKAAALDFEMSNADRVAIDEDKYSVLKSCLTNVYAHKSAKAILSSGKSEQTVLWKDSEFNIDCKARPDLYADGICVDVKTTSDASPSGFSRQIASLNYHVQAYHYLRGLSAATGIEHEQFIIVAVETKAPFPVAVYSLDIGTLDKARSLWMKAVGLYSQCVSLNEWPGYSDEVQSISIPAWAYMTDDE